MTVLSKVFPWGRVGNSLFEYAFIRALSERNKVGWMLPLWGGNKYFSMKWNEDYGIIPDVHIKEPSFEFCPEMLVADQRDREYTGYWQSEKYFADVWPQIKEDFRFEKSFLKATIKKAELNIDDNCVATHIRRGDYVSNDLYVNLPAEYYTEYIINNPGLKFFIFTDDYAYCKLNFEHLPNVVFMDGGFSDIEHLCLMSQFQRHFISNSSFSWWGAKLAELYNDSVKVVCPNVLFAGAYADKDIKDFYPERWEKREVFKIKPKKIEKKTEFTVVIPVKYDHQDREENLTLVINYLIKHFNPKIIVGEQGSDHFKYLEKSVKYIKFPFPYFHRTKMINDMIKAADTEVVFNWDADVLIPPEQVEETLLQLKNYDFVFPYDGRFVRVDRSFYPSLLKSLDTGGLKVPQDEPYNSKGGCVAFNVTAFKKIGLYNEHFLSHAPEDSCVYYRMNCLGTVKRVKGPLFHIDHFTGSDSTHNNEFRVINTSEMRRVTTMPFNQLKGYIESWGWAK